MSSDAVQGRARIRRTADGHTERHIHVSDLILETELRVATELNLLAFRCPCNDCYGGLRKSIHIIRNHLRTVGRDPFLQKSMIGGDPVEGYPSSGIWIEDEGFDDDILHVQPDVDCSFNDNENFPNDEQGTNETQNPTLDEMHEVQRQVMEALDRGDALHRDAAVTEEVNDNEEGDGDTLDGLEELYDQATTPLYTGSKTSVVSATIIIMNMCAVFHVSNTFTDELLRYLSQDLLPPDNKLPGTHYMARKNIRRLGLNYTNIHACPDGCVLYDNKFAELERCPKCQKSRWVEGTTSIPMKIVRHFPLIPRLKRMWRSAEIARMLTGYTKHISEDGVMRSVVDSPTWKHVNTDAAFNNFGQEKRNMRFALALDGVNPFKLSNTNWSTWPILILTYNFEPWFVTKKFFISLCILISGKHSPTSKNIDVYVRLLLKELHELWEGISVLDFSEPEGSRGFTVRGLLMWTISDFPAYGLISGLCCKGYRGCPCCGPETDSRMAKTGDVLPNGRIRGSKIVYGGMRRYLTRHHPYRQNKRFNGKVEVRCMPPIMSALDVIRYAAWRQSYLDLGRKENGKADPVHCTGVKRLTEFYELPYWQHLLERHLLDPMHCKKNLCENIMKTIMGMNDSAGSRRDVEDLQIREEIWLQGGRRGRDEYYMPHPSYVLKPEERREFIDIITNIRTPSNYVGSIHKRFMDGKLQYMKTHDYHVLMQQVLPVAVRNVLHENVRSAIIRISRVFQKLCEKEVRVDEKDEQLHNVIMATCELEKEFPPTFLNIMSHLPVHLVQQLFICGPVHCRWMYPIERYMKTLKDYVRTYAHPEGSIAEGYRMDDTLGFCTEYMKQYRGTTHRVWDTDEDATMNDEVLSSNERVKRKMSNDFRQYAHAFVLDNAATLQTWQDEYIQMKGQRWEEREAFRLECHRRRLPVQTRYPAALDELPSFSEWFRGKIDASELAGEDLDSDILQYARPPERYATCHRHMYACGMHLRVRSAEVGLVTHDSCVVASFTSQLWWGIVQGRPITRTDDYVGYIEEILELDYRNHCTTVLVCDWVRSSIDARYQNLLRDRYGFSIANFNRMDGKVYADSFAFPLHCQQVFFSDDPHRRGWKVVCRTDVHGKRRQLHLPDIVNHIVNVGNDADFEGLQPQMLATEPVREAAVAGGSFIRVPPEATTEHQGQL